LNLGGENGFAFSYLNFTGSYDTDQEDYVKYGSFYQQTPYQQSLNGSSFRLDTNDIFLLGGSNDGGIQSLIHSPTNTG